jgi:hypothetical protein
MKGTDIKRGINNTPIGENHPSVKMTEKDVRELRRLVAMDVCVNCAVKILGLNVSQTTAWEAANFMTWRHVHD